MIHLAGQFDAVDDVAPLVRAAHLQRTAIATVQLQKVGRLHQHVVELEEGQRLLAIQAQLDRVEAQHAVDGEVRAVVAQELQVAQLRQPLVVIQHDGVGRAVAESQEFLEHAFDAGDVLGDLLFGQQGALGVLERRIADLGRAAAHQDDRLVPGLLQTTQQHDLDQVADMQRRRRRVEPDIARDHAGRRRLVQFDRVGDLVDIAARLHQTQEV